MVLQVFPKSIGHGTEPLELIGDPARLPGADTSRRTSGRGGPNPRAVAFGLGALGPSFDDCRGRFGEFLAVAGYAAYRPSGGPGRPDFEHAAGAFVPAVRVLYGLAFPVGRSAVVRFEAKGDSGTTSVPLSQIAEACLDQAGGGAVGVVIVGETDGLVGAALQAVSDRPRRARSVRPPRRTRLALVHAGARACPEHGPGRRGGDPGGGPGTVAVRPAARGSVGTGGTGPLPRGGRPVPAAPRRRHRAVTDGLAPVRARPDRDDPPPAGRLAADHRGWREHVYPGGNLVRPLAVGEGTTSS